MAPSQPPLIVRITKHLHQAERFFLLGSVVGLMIYFDSTRLELLKFSLIGLAIVFFLYGYKPKETPAADDKKLGFKELLAYQILPNVMWIACAVSTIGILFYLLHLEGHQQMLMMGTLSLGSACFLFAILLAGGAKNLKTNAPVLYRVIPLFFTGGYLLMKLNHLI